MYRFGQVAEAIGISKGALRNWLAAGHVDGRSDRQEGSWRTFSRQQIEELAFTAELVRYGITVKDAHAAVQDAFRKYREQPAWPYKPGSLFVIRSPLEGAQILDADDLEQSHDQGGARFTKKSFAVWSPEFWDRFGLERPDESLGVDEILDFETRFEIFPVHIIRSVNLALSEQSGQE